MVVGEGNQNLTKASHGLHVVLRTVSIIALDSLMILVKCAKDVGESHAWFIDVSSFHNECVFSSDFNSLT